MSADDATARLRAILENAGLTPEQIERQLDPSIPQAVKNAEFAASPAGQRMTAINDRMEAMQAAETAGLERQLRDVEAKEQAQAARAARRTKIIVGAVAGVAVAGIGVWYFALRDTRSACAKLVGPLGELEQLTGLALEMRSGYESDHSCYQYVDRRGVAGGYIVNLETMRGSFESQLATEGRRKFTDKLTFPTALGDATLFVAGDATTASTEEVLADARARVGRTSDPMGAALSNLPPAQHVALVRAGGKTIKIALARDGFTADTAKAYVVAVAARAK